MALRTGLAPDLSKDLTNFFSSNPRRNFHIINASFVDALVLEAVDLDDLESIEGILSWRDMKAKEIGLTDVDKKLLMMQKKAQVTHCSIPI